MKKIPLRTCIVTKEKLPKKELVRVVRTKEGQVIIDETGKANGRGAYLKRDLDVFNQAQHSKVLNKHLEVDVPDKVYEDLRCLIK